MGITYLELAKLPTIIFLRFAKTSELLFSNRSSCEQEPQSKAKTMAANQPALMVSECVIERKMTQCNTLVYCQVHICPRQFFSCMSYYILCYIIQHKPNCITAHGTKETAGTYHEFYVFPIQAALQTTL